MSRPAPITDDERNKVRLMHGAGKSRNAIAQAIGRSPSTVSNIIRDAGLSFDRSAVAAATEAKQLDNRARRAAIVARLYARAEHNLDTLEADTYAYTATTVNGIETDTLGHVPAQDERHLASAISTNLGTAARLEAVDADDAAAGARSMLGNLADALGIRPPGE